MAEKKAGINASPERRPVLVSSGSSSTELSTTGSSDLQPFSLGRGLSTGNLSSYTVPVRLDVLYFLLNSAAKGAQNALPPLPAQGGQVPMSTCHGPAVYPSGTSCCSGCHGVPSCMSTQQHVGTHHFVPAQGSYSGHGGSSAGVPGRQDGGHHWVSTTQQSDGRSRSDWNRDQSPTGWKDNPRWGGRGQGNRSGNSWQGRPPISGRSYGDRRQGAGGSAPWNSGSQGWRREGPSFGSNAGSNPRNQEGNRRQMSWDIPEAKRRSDGAGMGWQKSQESQETAPGKIGSANQVAQGGEEDWEVDYKSEPATSAAAATPASGTASGQEDQGPEAGQNGKDKCAASTGPPTWGLLTSPLPELALKDQGSAAGGKEPGGSHADHSKNSGFVSYLKNLYSDLPVKSSPESSTDLIIDTDVESSKPSEEESSPKSVAEAVCK
ncbi:hypothetical protein JRQ81_011575 [Phrynocephalus forsythii]|uniref:Uncharacterized protein n=1 Tax=Phrynocephalus forsythii TaxID=171643 RepID=A0A9Q0X6F8_9SAUR|nr:hypothetical protein JRQ81_011575 [Phrynocephalus forsythii]